MHGIISGHAGGSIREAFCEAIEDAGSDAPRLRRSDWTQLWDCTDILPSEYCDDLDLPPGSTYAQAVRSLD